MLRCHLLAFAQSVASLSILVSVSASARAQTTVMLEASYPYENTAFYYVQDRFVEWIITGHDTTETTGLTDFDMFLQGMLYWKTQPFPSYFVSGGVTGFTLTGSSGALNAVCSVQGDIVGSEGLTGTFQITGGEGLFAGARGGGRIIISDQVYLSGTTTAIPEPATLLLVGLGAAGLLVGGRRSTNQPTINGG